MKYSCLQRVIIVCLLLCWVTFSQQVYAESLYVERIGLEQGLPQNTVTSIAQDGKGFMWFGTQTSLARYDGYDFKVYTHGEDNPNNLSNGNTWALLVDKQGVLWVGTYGGLNRYNEDLGHFTSYTHDVDDPHSLSQNNIWALLESKDGAIWVGTGHGLNRFDRKQEQFTRFMYDENNTQSISSNVVNELFEDSQGDMWVATDRGLNRFRPELENFERIDDRTLAAATVTSIAEDALGRLWVGSDGHGLFILDKSRKKISRKLHNTEDGTSVSTNKIEAILKDSKDQLWIGTDNGGLERWDEKNKRFIHHRYNPSDPHSLSEDVIYSLYEDRGGVLWVGTYTKGLSKINPYGFSSTVVLDYPSSDNPHPHTDIRGFLEDSSGALWVASSSNGIRVTLPNGKRLTFMHDVDDPTSISSNKVYSLYEDSDGVIWIGTANAWLNRYNQHNKTFTRYKIQRDEAGSIRHGKVLAIDEDNSGLLWVGLERGAAHSFNRNTGKFTHFHHEPEDPNTITGDRVFDLHVGRDDNVWFATFGGGLSHYDQKTRRFTNYRHDPEDPESINMDFISVIHEDLNEDRLWLGMDGGGVTRFDVKEKKFTNYNESHGLADPNTYCIVQDDNGHLWVGHNRGLSRFDINTETFLNYTQKDGLQSDEFNGGADYRAPDGKLYLGGIAGYNAFYADQIIDNPHQPSVYIIDFQLFNRPVEINKEYNGRVLLPKMVSGLEALTLSYKDSIFSFEFSALDYANPVKNQYAYKMEGLESDWNYIDSKRRFVTYTTLPPGDYTFNVKASNNNGVWNEHGTRLAITITPPFWQTWWFRSAAILLIIVVTYAVFLLRIRSIRERNKMLESEVKARTAELQKEKATLEDTLVELGETKDALIEAAHKAGMADTATGVLHNVGNLLNSVNTSAGIIRETVDNSMMEKIHKANKILIEHENDFSDFINNNPKGKKLLSYYISLDKPLTHESTVIRENIIRLKEKITAINETIAAQQRYAKGGGGFYEALSLQALVEDSLLLQSASIGRHEIKVIRNYEDDVPPIKVQKAKLVQILVNLYKNAKESMDECKSNKNILTIEIKQDKEFAYISYSDTGLGIEEKQLQEVFAHGFTTKASGHGFGLHTCANFMTEMGGKIWVESNGLNKGAKFILSFPLENEKAQNSDKAPEDDLPQQKIA